MNENYTVLLDGLAAGRTSFRWTAGREFFAEYENTEIHDADLVIDVTIEKSGQYIGVDCQIEGTVTVVCDRCLDDVTLPVSRTVHLSVKFSEGDEVEESDSREGDREIVSLPLSDTGLDLGQVIYDYTCLSLPLQKVHPAGECNPEVVRYLSGYGDDAPSEDGREDNPFASLKDLF